MKIILYLILITTLTFAQDNSKKFEFLFGEDVIVGGYFLNGDNQYLTRAFTQSVNGVSFFIRPYSDKAVMNFGTDLEISINSLGQITYGSSYASTTTWVNGEQTTQLTMNGWNFVTCTFNAITSTVLEVGRYSTSYFFGNINQLRIWNRALTLTDHRNSYNNGRPDAYTLTFADIGGSNTVINLNPTFEADADDALPANWFQIGNHTIQAKTDGTAPEGAKVAEIVASGAMSPGGNYIHPFSTGSGTMSVGKRTRLTFWAKSISGETTMRFPQLRTTSNLTTEVSQVITSDWVLYTIEGYNSSDVMRFGLTALGTFRIDNFKIISIGCVAEYKGENAGATWTDGSGNNFTLTKVNF
jgi:hypothetical protein